MAVYVGPLIKPRKKTLAVGTPCPYCGRTMKKRPNVPYVRSSWLNRCVTLEHVVPQHTGPRGSLNIIVACGRCNELKGGMMPEEWLEWVLVNRPAWAANVRAAIVMTGYQLPRLAPVDRAPGE